MGYEIKIHIGEISKHSEDIIFIEIASLDLSKVGEGVLEKLIKFSKGKSDTIDFSDFKFLRDVRGNHLGLSGDISDLFELGHEYDKVYIWENDEKKYEDLYGDPLPAIPIKHFLSAIKEELKTGSYRRFILAKELLEAFSNSNEWNDIYVVPFGH